MAYELRKRGIGVTVVERAAQPGGLIRTEHVDGFTIEAGPDSVLTITQPGSNRSHLPAGPVLAQPNLSQGHQMRH